MAAKLSTNSVSDDSAVLLPSAVDNGPAPETSRASTSLARQSAGEKAASRELLTGDDWDVSPTNASESLQKRSSIIRPRTSPPSRTESERRSTAIRVPTENTLFADAATDRIESNCASPRAGDTLVIPVESTLVEDSSVPLVVDHDNVYGSRVSPSDKANVGNHKGKTLSTDSRSFDHSPGAAIISEEEYGQNSLMYEVKSSMMEARVSKTPRRNSLERLLGPAQGITSRIHPMAVYAPTPTAGDPDSDEETGQRIPDTHCDTDKGDRKHTAPSLTTQTVQVAQMKPTTPSKPGFHTQRSIYKLTQATLGEYFDKPSQSRNGLLVVRVLFVCIITNIAALAFETCDGQNRGSSAPGYPYLPDESVYKALDAFFTSVFSIESLGRMIAKKRKRDILTDPLTWIDVLSLSPWYLQLVLTLAGTDFNLGASEGVAHKMGLLRLLRVVRLGYILRNYESMKILVTSLKASIPPLMVTMFFLFTLVMLLATAIFYAEPCYNVNTCPFTDIFNSAYFIMVTVATVGYGNQIPSTNNVAAMGVAFVAMVFGQLYLAMPLAIVGNNFQDAYENFQQSKRRMLKRLDTTLNAFDSVKLDRKSQRLCDIQYHLLESWRVIQLNIDKVVSKGIELGEIGGYSANESTRSMMAGQIQQLEALVDAQLLRLARIRDAIDKLTGVHGEVCTLLQAFVPHKRKARGNVLTRVSAGDTMLLQVFGRARKAMALARFGSRDKGPDPRTMSQSRRGRLWLALEVPDSSRIATAVNRVMMGATLLSVWIFFCESLPELMGSGVESAACQRVVSTYCESTGWSSLDRGCFARHLNNTVSWDAPLDFTCDHSTDRPSCYGGGLSFGSLEEGALSCVDAFDEVGAELICFRMQCIASAAAIVDMEPYWIYFEWIFGWSFLTEMILRFYASHDRPRFFQDVYNIFDVLAVLPFGFELCDYAFFGVVPSYAIVATAPSFFSAIRVLKTMRILKLTRHFRGTKVLAQTAKETWRQLLVPIFFLLTMCILAAAIYFEVERGTECFVGEPCIWWQKDLMTPELTRDLPVGKRVLVQDKKQSIITDMLRSTWLSAATFTTVGYGDMRPRTPMGRMFTICIAVVASIYTAMPITLVGGKFRSLYARHAEKVVVRRGGSSTSWKTKRNLLNQSVRDNDGSSDPLQDSSHRPVLFKLEEEEIEQLRQFQSLKRVFQHLQRQIDNLQEVNRDVVRTGRPKRQSVAGADGAPPSVSNNVTRRSASIEHAIQEKSFAIMDAILQFSSLVEKLQDAPPFYEAFLPEEPNSMHQNGGVENLLSLAMQKRLLHADPSQATPQ